MKTKYISVIAFLLIIMSCSQLPKEKLSQFEGNIVDYSVENDTLRISLSNPLHCPLRIDAESTEEGLQKNLAMNFPVAVPPKRDTVLFYASDRSKEELQIGFSAKMGDPQDSIYKREIYLPFTKGNKFKILQGYNGSFSHNTDYSRYAVDFNLQVGDTICAAADGFVVGVIEGYTEGGSSKKWRDFANFITIFHPDMNLYTQYVHLMHNGSFVEVGDEVHAEQVIGLSGATGFRDAVHLHFNVLRANESSMQSAPITFKEGYRGIDLKKGDWVEK